ncbi:hypothetical protein [Halarcobacter ebronensis]|uniref:Uncharacterized protein n=1 Tax=Halarcobacter ebronensis TaxID=1462615 RepID=A0A4Q1AY93_9BACT|nr:hypothetical protein [Halarcobacter ebronensis]QKF81091.1 hypothetical protein AEBR_0583 [Halarcobacter ebronensis]RXK06396.1 hypothetical protein CRV07_06805 [Halarcobacter ebronensis]
MNRYLDINSLIVLNYFENNDRLTWHISHKKYDEFAQDIYKWLYEIDLDDKEFELFNISSPIIYQSLSTYLTHVYDYIILEEKREHIFYSQDSSIYIDKIWKKQVIDSIFSIELEKKRFKRSKIKSLYSFLIKYIPKNFFDAIIISKNQLVTEFVNKSNLKTIYLSPSYYFKINTNRSYFTDKIAKKLANNLIEKIENEYFKLFEDHKASIEFIINTLLSRAHNDLKSYNGFLKSAKNVITGTGNNYYNRLLSTIAKKENCKVSRFYHGGDRCFFNDPWYWESEFFQTDYFYTYGKKWGNFAKNKVYELNKNIDVISLGSKYHTKIYNKYFGKKIGNRKRILYIPNSFVGELRQFPYAKIIDPLLFDWQKYLIDMLQKNGFDVIYKKHPKGFFQEENILGKIAKHESTNLMIEALSEADIVICDMAGSAFVESLCAGKDIILIDTLQRPFDIKNKRNLQKAVKIVEGYWEDNILKVDEKILIETINFFNIEDNDKDDIIKEYYINKD